MACRRTIGRWTSVTWAPPIPWTGEPWNANPIRWHGPRIGTPATGGPSQGSPVGTPFAAHPPELRGDHRRRRRSGTRPSSRQPSARHAPPGASLGDATGSWVSHARGVASAALPVTSCPPFPARQTLLRPLRPGPVFLPPVYRRTSNPPESMGPWVATERKSRRNPGQLRGLLPREQVLQGVDLQRALA